MAGNCRIPVEEDSVERANALILSGLDKRLRQHGYGSFASIHEILGIMDEEHYELLMAVHQNDTDQVLAELVDIAVGALFGIASIIQINKEK